MKKIIFLFVFLFFLSNNCFAKQRYFLLDRNINSVYLDIDNSFDITIKNSILERLKKNNISILENSKEKIIIKLIDIKSEEKKIILSEFGEYDIIDNEIIATIKLEIYDKENNIIWNRKLSKLNSQKWIDFNKQKIGTNIPLQVFYAPVSFDIDSKRKYNEKEFINITILELINSILDNLIY